MAVRGAACAYVEVCMNTAVDTLGRTALAEEFLRNVYATHGGERVRQCIQCGNCTASCPTSHLMDYPPRLIFAALRAGQLDTVLKSNTIWMCASCYQCQVRCPVQINITDVMYELKRMAVQHNLTDKRNPSPVLTRTFVNLIEKDGRSSEGWLGILFSLRGKGLWRSIKELPFAFRLWRKGRLSLKHERVRDPKRLAQVLDKIGDW
jgi:heterodisulfide reductase subunit C